MAYYIAEVQNAESTRSAHPTRAQTLAGAKRAASRRQMFRGTTLVVLDATGRRLSVNKGRGWVDLGEHQP